MEMLNFDGVEEASKGYTLPGTKGIFEIKSVTTGESSEKKTPFLKVHFEDDSSKMDHDFYLTQGALPRIQSLYKAIFGKLITGQINPTTLATELTGKKVGLLVTGKVGSNGKGYNDLDFGNFCFAPANLENVGFSNAQNTRIAEALAAQGKATENHTHVAAEVATETKSDDLPF